MGLHVLAYNFRRLMVILGLSSVLAAIRAYAGFLKRFGLLWAVTMLGRLNFAKSRYGLAQSFLLLYS